MQFSSSIALLVASLQKARNTMRLFITVRTLTIVVVVFLGATFFGESATFSQGERPDAPRGANQIGFPWDWSHDHVVFSKTADPKILVTIQQDPRLLHRQRRQNLSSVQAKADSPRNPGLFSAALKRSAAALNIGFVATVHAAQSQKRQPETLPLTAVRGLPLAVVILGLTFAIAFLRRRRWLPTLMTVLAILLFLILASCGGAGTPTSGSTDTPLTTGTPSTPQTLGGDWGANIGAASAITAPSSATAAPMYPAKYTFNVNQNPNCTGDYVVFATGASGTNTGLTPTPSIVAFNELYASQGGGSPAGFCSTTGPSVAWAYLNVTCATSTTTSSDPILSSPVLSLDGTKVAWVTSTGKVQILTIGTVGSNGSSVTNPVCVENAPGGVATTPNNAVLNSVTLRNAQNNPTSGVSLSELFVDYTSDSAYVGDDDGFLHKITPFFTAAGALQEVTTPSWQASQAHSVGDLIVDSNGFIEKCTHAGTSGSGAHPAWGSTWGGTKADNTVIWTNQGSGGGWPVYVTGSSTHINNSALSGPVFDSVSKNIFIGDQHGSLFYVLDPGASTAVGSCANGATLHPCGGTPGTTSGIAAIATAQKNCSTASPSATCMVMSNKEGFTDSVIVDSSDSLVITQFANADTTNSEVEQTNTSLGVFNSATLAGQVNLSHHTGAFDNTYYSTPASGYYYVCGPDSTGKMTDLYRVGFTNTAGTIALGSTNGTPFQLTVTNKTANCSPMTEIYNTVTSTDWLFLSVDNQGVTPTCGAKSCVMSFILGSSMVSGVNASYAGSGSLTGTSGIIVDNVANTTTFPQASSIYFAPVSKVLSCGDGSTNTACGIKLTQSGLQ